MKAANRPLADQLRPQSFSDFIGQQHLLGPGKPLQSKLHSMLLWGPPGCGKTSVAKLVAANTADVEVLMLSPTSAGVKEIKQCVAEATKLHDAQPAKHMVLFVDEIHRFNRAQQDYFLPHVESGLLTLIGATTENPSFELTSALLSRLIVYRLQPLSPDQLEKLLERGVANLGCKIEPQAIKLLVNYGDGDGRRLLNLLEHVGAESKSITVQQLEVAITSSKRRFDKSGDEFYDQISALHKSVRGSDPDAALYWLCRMLDGGADPVYLLRRIIRMAAEDIGLAEPHAMTVALDANRQFRLLGSPEGELGIACAVVYLACAPKSNAVYKAFSKMGGVVKKHGSLPVPDHLCNAPTKLLKEQGKAVGYRYAHDEPHGYAAGAHYFPDQLVAQRLYQPVDRGLEVKIATKLVKLRKLDEIASQQNPNKG